MSEPEVSRNADELEALVRELRQEIEHLREQLRQLRRNEHESPPHYR